MHCKCTADLGPLTICQAGYTQQDKTNSHFTLSPVKLVTESPPKSPVRSHSIKPALATRTGTIKPTPVANTRILKPTSIQNPNIILATSSRPRIYKRRLVGKWYRNSEYHNGSEIDNSGNDSDGNEINEDDFDISYIGSFFDEY